MYVYRITFLGGGTTTVRANSPKEAWNFIFERWDLEIIAIKFIR